MQSTSFCAGWKGRSKPLASCWHSPPPRTPSSPRASSLQSSAAPSPLGSSGRVFPPSPPLQRPLWNDVAPASPQPPSSRALTFPSCSNAGGSHPRASPDVYGQLVSRFLPLLVCSCVCFSFHQILHLTGRKNREDGRLFESEHFVSTANRTVSPLPLMKDAVPAGSFALWADCGILGELSVFKRFPFILISRHINRPF